MLLLSGFAAEAQQSFVGFRESEYAGTMQRTANPAYMISSKRPWDATLFLANVNIGTNAVKLSTDIAKSFNNFESASKSLLNNNNINARLNIDVLGPSAFFKIGDKHSVGFFTRVRALGNINDIDAKLIQSYISDVKNMELRNNYSINLKNQEVVLHGFSEFGLSWAGELYFDGHNAIKAGASVKYIMGAGNLYVGFRDFAGSASLTVENDKLKVNIDSRGGNFEVLNGGTDLVKLSNLSSSSLLGKEASTMGLDLGVVYEYRFDGCRTCHNRPHDFKVGLSLMDIGNVQYKLNKQSFRYQLPASGAIKLSLDDLSEEALTKAGLTTATTQVAGRTVKSSLPTTLNLSADYRIIDGLYVSAAGNINVASKSKADQYNANYASTYSLTPHYDISYFGAYLPISYNEVTKTSVGLGLRLGSFLTIGSSSIISNLAGGGKDLNVFVGLGFGHIAYPTEKSR